MSVGIISWLIGQEHVLWHGNVRGEVGALYYKDGHPSGFYEITRNVPQREGDLIVYGILCLPCVLEMRTAARITELLNAARRPEAKLPDRPADWNERTVCDEYECPYFRMGYLHVHTPQGNIWDRGPVFAPNAPPLAEIASGLSAQNVCPPACRTTPAAHSAYYSAYYSAYHTAYVSAGTHHWHHDFPTFGVTMRPNEHIVITRPAAKAFVPPLAPGVTGTLPLRPRVTGGDL